MVGDIGDQMTVDFKGQFLMRNGLYSYPLTIVDHFSRCLLCCHACSSNCYYRTYSSSDWFPNIYTADSHNLTR